MSRPLRRSYFDLLKEKYPDPDEPRAAISQDSPPSGAPASPGPADGSGGPAMVSRRTRPLLAVVLGLLTASLVTLCLGVRTPSQSHGQPAMSELPRTAEPRPAKPPVAESRTAKPRIAEPRIELPVQRPRPAARPRVPAEEPAVQAVEESRTHESHSSEGPPEPAAEEPPAAERRTADNRTAPGVKLFAPQPEYPAAARHAGLEGVVLVEARVDGTGHVSDARVLRGSSPELDLAALEALRRWRFEPARRGDQPLAYRYRQEFRFALDPRPPESPPAPASAARPADVEVTPPVRLATPLPGYTAAAWAAGVEGSVEIKATIDERGEVAGIDVVRGLPHGLTEAAVAAVRRWKFRPATRDGKPVPAEQNLSLRFAL